MGRRLVFCSNLFRRYIRCDFHQNRRRARIEGLGVGLEHLPLDKRAEGCKEKVLSLISEMFVDLGQMHNWRFF